MFRQLVGLLLLWSTTSFAQDSLVYLSGRIVTGQVDEIGVETVRYRTNSGDASVNVVAEKRELQRVRLKDGQEFVFNGRSSEIQAALVDKRDILSLDVIAPALNHVVVGYERRLGDRTSLNLRAGYIGIAERANYNYDNLWQSKGFLVKAGVKFMLPTNRRRTTVLRAEHPLAGWYLMPELSLSDWDQKRYYYYDPYVGSTFRTVRYTSAALQLVVGRQLMLGERVSFDVHAGLGYGLQWVDGEQQYEGYPYYINRQNYSFSHAFTGSYSPMVVSGGLSFGYLF